MNVEYFVKIKNSDNKLEVMLESLEEMNSIYPPHNAIAVNGLVKMNNEIGIYHNSLNNNTMALDYLLIGHDILKDYYQDKFTNHSYAVTIVSSIQSIGIPLEMEAIKSYKEGRYEEGVGLFTQLFKMIKSVFPESHLVVSKYAEYLGKGYFELNQCDKAIAPLEFSLNETSPNIIAMLNTCKSNDIISETEGLNFNITASDNSCIYNSSTGNLTELFVNYIIPQCQSLGNYTTIDDCYKNVSQW